MANVPTSNLTALYTNTTAQTTADPAAVDNAIIDIVATINGNSDNVNTLISAGTLSRLGIINVKDYNASGNGAITTTGTITSGSPLLTVASTTTFAAGQGINLRGVFEIASLAITAACTSSANCTVTLNGVAKTVALVNGDTTSGVATKIRAAIFPGWTTGGSGVTVTFTCKTTGTKTDASYTVGTTGATATMTTTTQGVADQITTISSINSLVVTLAANATRTITAGTIMHDDTAAIVAAIDTIRNDQYLKGGGHIVLPVPTSFYPVTSKIDLSEFWNLKLSCPSKYNHQRQLVYDINMDYSLLHWFGAQDGIMMEFDYSFGITLENISLNGRDTADIGFSLSRTATAASSVKYFTGYDIGTRGCKGGMRIGDDAVPDDFPVVLYNPVFERNLNYGLKVYSGNAGVEVYNPVFSQNGETPEVAVGCNVYLKAGELQIFGYGSDGLPSTSDIYQESGGLRVNGGWSDVTSGLFLKTIGASSANVITGIRHYDGAMTTSNTPLSIDYQGVQPLTLIGCFLYNSVQINSGNQSHCIAIGTQFSELTATFIGDMVTTNNGLLEIGTVGQNQMRLSGGRTPRTDVGTNMPWTWWSDTNRTNTIKSAGSFAITDLLNAGDFSYHTYTNAYYDGTNHRSIAVGRCAYVYLSSQIYTISAFNSTVAGEVVTWTEKFAIRDFYNGTSIGADGKKQIWNGTAPTSSTFGLGDVCWNNNTSVGGIGYWECTTAGTPGTWTPRQIGTLSSTAATPLGIGFISVVAGVIYMSKAVASSADWVQIS